VARVRSRTGDRAIVAEVKQSGQPRFARDAANQLLRYTSAVPGSYGVFVAPYVTAQADAVCSGAGVGYVDLAGNCRLAFDDVYIRTQGMPNPYAETRDLRSLYSPRAERVLRTLLGSPGRPWRLQALSTEAQVSLGHASGVRRLLDSREWLTTTPEGFVLGAPEALLSEWAESYRPGRSPARGFYGMDPVADLEARLATACGELGVRYALTGFSGSARLAPSVRYQRATAYVAGGVDDVARALQLSEVPSGANITLLTPYDDGVFCGAQRIGSDQVVTAVQCYLDVRPMAARGQEAADVLLERVIRPTW
jgi:hypothetical protein